jgi:hypothetical protein
VRATTAFKRCMTPPAAGDTWTWARRGCSGGGDPPAGMLSLRPGPYRDAAVGRPAARFTRDFEDVVTYLAQRTDKTTITRLRRCSWGAVAATVVRVVASHIDDTRLDDR